MVRFQMQKHGNITSIYREIIYMHIDTRPHTHTHVRTLVSMHVCVCKKAIRMCVNVCVCVWIFVCVWVYLCMCACTCVYVYINLRVHLRPYNTEAIKIRSTYLTCSTIKTKWLPYKNASKKEFESLTNFTVYFACFITCCLLKLDTFIGLLSQEKWHQFLLHLATKTIIVRLV